MTPFRNPLRVTSNLNMRLYIEGENVVIGCHTDGMIVDILDAVYGAAEGAPPWMFDESVGMCQPPASGNIPVGSSSVDGGVVWVELGLDPG